MSVVAWVVLALVISAGCGSRPPRVNPPDYDANAFADALLERCDTNGDGLIAKDESASAPGLLTEWSAYDLDGSGTISREELKGRVAQWLSRGDGIVPVTCIVRMDNRQIGDVLVKFVPDESLRDAIQPAMTVTDAGRATVISIPPELKKDEYRRLSGMQYGLYQVEVSHPRIKLVPADDSRGFDIGPSDQATPVVIRVVTPKST